MLNELVIVERGLCDVDIDVARWDQDVKKAGKKPTLRVSLDVNGQVFDVDPVPKNLALWTFGKGNKQRFPFMQPNKPLMRFESTELKKKLDSLSTLRADKRRAFFLELCQQATFNDIELQEWPGVRDKNGGWSQDPADYLESLIKRREQILGLKNTEGESVIATIDRFLVACSGQGNGGANLLRQVAAKLVKNLERSTGDDWLYVSQPLLFLGGGALFFDVPSNEYARLASDPRQIVAVSHALKRSDTSDLPKGKCSLTGEDSQLVVDAFPEVVVEHAIGKIILFSRFDAIPSNARYGRFGAKSFSASQDVVEKLAASLRWLTSPQRKGKTWMSIPGESPKQNDLLLAFVEAIPDAPVVESLAEEDFSAEIADSSNGVSDSIATFEKRTERTIQLIKAKVTGDLTKIPVQLMVLRKVDTANRKVVFAKTLSVANFHRSATDWTKGERNVPAWLTLPVPLKGEHKLQQMPPPHVAPMGLIGFSKQLFICGGSDQQEVLGLSAAEAMRIFLDSFKIKERLSSRILRLALVRRSFLLAGVAHVQHLPSCWGKRSEAMKKYDRKEALRTITVLGLLLHKLNRKKEDYMNETAFKLGQLLAAVDVVHAGYCADVRGGAVPPALLGNQVFPMAQTSPTKALAVLCRRWKPYDGWAKKTIRESARIQSMIASNRQEEQQCGWDIKKALRHARGMGSLAADLAPSLDGCRPNDVFRAELLLGYMAGFPKLKKQDVEEIQDHNQEQEE